MNRLAIDSKLKRLYISSKEGLLLFFQTKSKEPNFVFSLKVVKKPKFGSENYIS